MPIPLNPQLATLQPYPPGKPIEEVQRELGLDRVVKLASNENPLGPSPRALAALHDPANEFQLYPDGHAFALRRALAQKLGVAAEQLVFGSGSDEILLLLSLTFLAPGLELVTSQHAFVRAKMNAQIAGAETKELGVIPRHFEQDVEAMAHAVGKRTRAVYLANPNNPTGDMVPGDRVKALLEHLPEDVLFILDEAYYEYCADHPDYECSIPWLADHPNLLILRTFSKAYGLAGLRCGYGIGHPDVVRDLERVRPPFNVTRAAQIAALAALGDEDHIRRAVEVNRAGIAQVTEGLAALPLDVTPSHGNFVLIDVRWPAKPVFDGLLRRGVIVRPVANYGLLTHLRVSIGTEEENALFLEALRATLAEAR
jgi:histidinol-phosphate aminotransferase